jgi:hypothetical protein
MTALPSNVLRFPRIGFITEDGTSDTFGFLNLAMMLRRTKTGTIRRTWARRRTRTPRADRRVRAPARPPRPRPGRARPHVRGLGQRVEALERKHARRARERRARGRARGRAVRGSAVGRRLRRRRGRRRRRRREDLHGGHGRPRLLHDVLLLGMRVVARLVALLHARCARTPSLLRRAISGPNSRTGAGSQLPSASAPSDGESMSGPLMQRAIYGGCAATSLPAGDCGAPGLRPSPNPKPSPWLGLGRICRLRLLSKSELSRLIRGEPVRGDLRDEPRGESAGEPDGDTNTGRPFVIDATYACAGVGVGVGSAPGTVCDVRRIVLGAVIDFCCAKGAAGGVRKRTW